MAGKTRYKDAKLKANEISEGRQISGSDAEKAISVGGETHELGVNWLRCRQLGEGFFNHLTIHG